nr:MAG TPA: hypothetical protein [Caudoviricetes sp.]
MSDGIIVGCGGGAGLNFRVKAYASELTLPATEVSNTIAVLTDETISKWALAADEPETPEEGMVWIQTGAAASVPINALKKNVLMIYPTGCKQYVSGAWVIKQAKTYINGAWTDWYTYLLSEGVTLAALGSWTNKAQCSFTGGKIVCSAAIDSETEGLGGWCFPTALDVTNFKTLYIKLQITETQSAGMSTSRPLMIGFFDSIAFANYNNQKGHAKATTQLAGKAGAEQTASVSLEALTGSYYLAGLSMLGKYSVSEMYLA